MVLKKLLLAFIAVLVIMVSCSKEYSYEYSVEVKDVTPQLTATGWQFDGNGDGYYGCISSAIKANVNNQPALVVQAADTSGDNFTLTVGNLYNVKAGNEYTIGQSIFMTMIDSNGVVYNCNMAKPGSFVVKVVTCNDSLFIAAFAGTLISADKEDTMKIENGAIRTLIGKTGDCMYAPKTPAVDPNAHKAVFDFTNDACDNKVIGGTLTATVPATNANTIKYNVNVTDTGVWNISLNTVDGITYAGSGKFNNPGVQSIILTASGTPTTAGAIDLTLKINNVECTTELTVNDAPPPTSPTCNINTGTVLYASLSSTFSSALTWTTSTGTNSGFFATSNASQAISISFNGTDKPAAGIYKITSSAIPEVGTASVMYMISSTETDVATEGYVYVTINNNKRTIAFCDIGLSTPFNNNLLISCSGKLSE